MAYVPERLLNSGGVLVNNPSAGIGYATGAGGAVTQITSKATTVELNKVCGAITLHNAAMDTYVSTTFQLTNSAIAATDAVIVNHASGGTAGAYACSVGAVTGGSCKITILNITGGTLTEAPVLNFAVIKAVSA